MGAIDTLTTDQQLEAIYVGYFGRAADGGGLAFWEGQYVQATTPAPTGFGESIDAALQNIANSFEPQTETTTLYPFLANPGSVVGSQNSTIVTADLTNLIISVYQNLFDRMPAATDGGVLYWLGQLQSGAVGLGQAILDIANGATGADATTLLAKISAADFFTSQTSGAGLGLSGTLSPSFIAAATTAETDVTTTGDLTASKAATTAFIAATPSGVTVDLTPAAITASANQFIGATFFDINTGTNIQTLVAGDVLTGTGTNPTLTATLFNNIAPFNPLTPTLKGIDTLVLTALGAANLNAVNFDKSVTTITNNASTQALQVGPMPNAITTLNVENVVSGGAAATLIQTTASAVAAGTALAINLTSDTGAGAGAIVLQSVGGATGFGVLNVTASGSASTVAALTSIGTSGAVDTTLNIAGTSGLTISQLDTTLTKISATGDSGALTLGSGATPLLEAGAAVSITGGSGATQVFVGNLGSAYTIDLGSSGANILSVVGTTGASTAATIKDAQTIDLFGVVNPGIAAGAGYEGVAGAIINLSKATGVTTLQLDGADTVGIANTATVTVLGLVAAGLAISDVGDGAASGQSFNGLSLVGGTDSGALTVTIGNGGTSIGGGVDVVGPMNVAGFTSAVVTINDTVETSATSSTVNLGDISDSAMTSLTISGATALNINGGGVDTLAALTTLNMSGVTGDILANITSSGTTFNLSVGAAVGAAGDLIQITDTSATSFTATSGGVLNLFAGGGDWTKATTETFTETGTAASAILTVHPNAGAALSSLTLTGSVVDTVTADAVTTGITVSGSTDDHTLTFAATVGASSGNTDTFSLGNGTNAITDPSIAGTVNVILGSGANTISLGGTNNDTTGSYTVSITHGSAGLHDTIGVGSVGTTGFATNTQNLTVVGAATGDVIVLQNEGNFTPTQVAGGATIASIIAASATAAHDFAVTVIGGNTFVAESNAAAASAANTSVIEITGVHTFAGGTNGTHSELTLLT